MNEKTAQKIAVTICICTFQRAHIIDTLRSVFALELNPKWNVKIIVADNDETDSARSNVEVVAKENSLNQMSINYIHAPARNISIARNACLDAATTPLIAFIDDDELLTKGWLKAILEKFTSSSADVILGPVKAIYSPNCQDWLRIGDFHSTNPVWVNGKIITGYSCNVLINRISPALQTLHFREDLGRTGGEDTVYFASAHKAGAMIDFAPDAIITEAVPANRAKFYWLLKRRFRAGQTHGLLLIENSSNNIGTRIKSLVKTFVKLIFCLVVALVNIIRPVKMRFWLLRGALHTGVIARLLGKQEIIQYG
ncbi:MAG: glycosyltransferase family 2 protein [Rickettsiales bacterium]